MRTYKKLASLLLAMLLLCAVVAGCKSEPEPAPVVPAPAPEAPAEQGSEPTPEQPAVLPPEDTTVDASSYKVAMMLAGSISDGGWHYTQYQGIEKITALGAETSWQDNVAYTNASENMISYCEEGYNVIFLSTSNFLEYAQAVAPQYPDVTFFIVSSAVNEGNIRGFLIKDQDQGFMQGVIAALASESKKVGVIGGTEFTPIMNGLAGFEQGVKYIDESIEVVSTFLGNGTDTQLAKETATAMIEDGCDVIAPFCDNASTGVVQACEEKGAYAVGNGVGQDELAPTRLIVSVLKDTSIAIEGVFKLWMEGKLGSDVMSLGADNGVVFLSDWYGAADVLDDSDRQTINEALSKLASGEIVANPA